MRRPFVIAEIGVNHDGVVGRALELVEIARRCGADGVKLQVFRGRRLMNRAAVFAEYQKGRVEEGDPIAMLERYELGEGEMRQVVEAIEGAGMVALATPFSVEDVEVIRGLGLAMVKVASPDLVNYVLLRDVAKLGRPVLLSTGAATVEEIGVTMGWMKGWGVKDVTLLHCVSSYPTPVGETHLGWIGELKERFGVAVGYSDHSTEVVAGALAMAAGAGVLERHLTYDKGARGPDHSASSDPGEFAEYVRLARLAQAMVGVGGKRVLAVEEDVRKVSRQSLVTVREMTAGEVIGEADLKTQRPGTGIAPARLGEVVGRRMTRAVGAETLLDWSMIGG